MFSVKELRAITDRMDPAALERELGPFVLIQRPPREVVDQRIAQLAMAQTLPGRRERQAEGALSIIQEFLNLVVATLPPVRERDELVVGRQPDCDLVIDDPSVSKRHAVLTWDGTARACAVQDRGSRNGTRVDEAELGRRAFRLDDMAVISFGDADYWFMTTVALHERLRKWRAPRQ
jgi:hypothetical protein